MLSPSLDALLKLSKATYPLKLFDYDCMTLHIDKKEQIFLVIFVSFLRNIKFYSKTISITVFFLFKL